MKRETVQVEGLRELEAALAELSRPMARGVLQRSLKAAAKPIAEAARARAPERKGVLRDSIAISTKKPKGHDSGKAAFSRALRGGATKREAGAALRLARRLDPNDFAEVFVGPGPLVQAIMQEFGTVHHAAQPFMRPAWDSTRDRALSIAVATIRPEMERAIARAAQRAARKAAKAGKAAAR